MPYPSPALPPSLLLAPGLQPNSGVLRGLLTAQAAEQTMAATAVELLPIAAIAQAAAATATAIELPITATEV